MSESKVFQIQSYDMATQDTKVYPVSTIRREDESCITIFTVAQPNQTTQHFILTDDLVEAIAHFADKNITRWSK